MNTFGFRIISISPKICILKPVLCVCVVWQSVCAGILHEDTVPQVYSLLCPRSLLGAVSHPHSLPGKTGLMCRLMTPAKRQPVHHLCLSLVQFHIQSDKNVHLVPLVQVRPTWTIWSWFRRAVSLPVWKIAVDMEGHMFHS